MSLQQNKSLSESRVSLILNRISLSLLAGIAIACQTQSPSITSPTPTAEVSQPSASSPQPTTQSSQTAYTNEQFGFSFAYPAGYVIDDSYENPSSRNDGLQKMIEVWSAADYQAIQAHQFQGSEYPPNVNVTVYSNPQKQSLEEWVKSSDRFVATGDVSRQTLAGQDAIAFSSSGLYDNENIVLSTPDSAGIIVINLAKGGEEYPQVFEQIKSTFRFTAK